MWFIEMHLLAGKDIRGMNRTLPVKCTRIQDGSKDERNTVGKSATDEPVLGAVRALCELSLLVSQ